MIKQIKNETINCVPSFDNNNKKLLQTPRGIRHKKPPGYPLILYHTEIFLNIF